jgi:D-serine deaminase-like pyridoxal phosphate-dependent protein
LADYSIQNASEILTPALAIYSELVDQNLQTTLRLVGGNPARWRPHVKTAKLAWTMRRLVAAGVRSCKASTTLELSTACDAGFTDVLLAYPTVGAAARRALAIARARTGVAISTLIENEAQARQWLGEPVGLFIDVNTGMDRTGIEQDHVAEVVALARVCGPQFRGVHYYDGHLHLPDMNERTAAAHAGYDRLMRLVSALSDAGVAAGEVITSGTPAFPCAISYRPFDSIRHAVSPGTVVYNDLSSLADLPGFGYAPAVVVATTVVSRPKPSRATCDAGHKSVSADAGVPTCAVAGRPDLVPDGPSEEHLPLKCSGAEPAIGERLYLIPRHVCPTVNNFDEALIVEGGRVVGIERVTARGHESPGVLGLVGVA